ncbi:MAG: class II fructose-bisphosphatase [Candidatus Zixiibacteriota bacterium]
MDRNYALELVRVTEAASLAASRWVGKGDAVAADHAAAAAMHRAFGLISFSGRIALGEGEPGTVTHLFSGEIVGVGGDNNFDLALDALECTRSVAFGRTNAMAVVALAPTGHFHLPPSQYINKLAVGPMAAGAIDINLSVEENLYRIAEALDYSVADLTVVILDRERHAGLISEVRRVGSRIHLIPDGDVAAAIATAIPGSGIDILMGTGSSAAGVLAAAALRCLGGEIQARLAPTDGNERSRLKSAGHGDLSRVYRTIDMAGSENVMFAATGITDGDVLNGVCYRSDGATTHSMVMRSRTRTRRFIVTEHCFDDNPTY